MSIDVRPASIDGLVVADWNTSKNYDRQKTQEIVDMIRYIDPYATIYFNDPQIKGVSPMKDHDNHIHVTWSLNHMRGKCYRKSIEKYGVYYVPEKREGGK